MAVATSSKADIPLVRVNSATSSQYPPSYHTQYTTDSTLARFETASETASTITPFFGSPNFNPTSSLQIQAHGKTPLSFPTPGKQLEIPIFSPETGRPVYLSIKPSRRKGSCRLVSAEDLSETSISRTTYHFGPTKCPEVRIGADDDLDADVFPIATKSVFTRATVFESRKWGKFEWRYARKGERAVAGEDINNLLVLEKIVLSERGREERIRVAQLVRSEETRTPGTKAMFAGNGGRLEMALGKGEGEKGVWIDEVTVVSTCLVMLKKEIDRLRTVQIMVMSGAAGGGG
jgi:hypothetical protein